jgi:hypothetical protein
VSVGDRESPLLSVIDRQYRQQCDLNHTILALAASNRSQGSPGRITDNWTQHRLRIRRPQDAQRTGEQYLYSYQGRAERAVHLAARLILRTLPRTGIYSELNGPGWQAGAMRPRGTLAVAGPPAPP